MQILAELQLLKLSIVRHLVAMLKLEQRQCRCHYNEIHCFLSQCLEYPNPTNRIKCINGQQKYNVLILKFNIMNGCLNHFKKYQGHFAIVECEAQETLLLTVV